MTPTEILAVCGTTVGGLIGVGGALGKYVSKLLAERKDSVMQDMKIKWLEDEVRQLRLDIRDLREHYNKH